MKTSPLADRDRELVRAAEDIARERHRPGWNRVGAAIRLRSGEIVRAIHLEADVGRIAVCAEAIALGRLISDGVSPDQVETIVAVAPSDDSLSVFRVLDPCGMCRELITDYSPEAHVIVRLGGTLRKVAALDLIPLKKQRLSDAYTSGYS